MKKKNKSLPSLFLQGFQRVRGTMAHGIKEFPGYSYLGRPQSEIFVLLLFQQK